MSEARNPLMNKKRGGLGKGLSALLEDAPSPSASPAEEPAQEGPGSLHQVPVQQIDVNPYQPRIDYDQDALEELAESIRVHGIIQPITVRQLSAREYQLISGERRLRASKLAGLESVPAYVRTANDQQMLEMALIENIQRENLNAIEVALSYQRLISECNLKMEELGDRVGKKRSTVNNYLRLLKLPPEIQAAIRDQRLSMGHARALVNVDSIDVQLSLFHQIVENDLSVRRVEEMVRQHANAQLDDQPAATPGKGAKPIDIELINVQQRLASHFGTRVEVKAGSGQKGEIRIPYMSTADLNRILDLINAS